MSIKSHLFQIILLILLNCYLTICRETPEPAAYLRPRHFNPHPYSDGRRNFLEKSETIKYNKGEINNRVRNNIYNPGPVQFPTNPNDQNTLRKLSHPYRELSLKGRQNSNGRFNNNYDNGVISPTQESLLHHGKRIYKNERIEQYRDDEQDASSTKKHYAFSYTVKDHASGDDYTHSQQQQQDGAVRGSYKVQLPDGRTQIVKYVADNNGYHADVSYNVNGQEENKDSLIIDTSEQQIVQQTSDAQNAALLTAQPIYNYYKDLYVQGKPYTQDYAQYDEQVYHNNEHDYNSVVSSTPSYDVSPTPHSTYNHQVNVANVNINGYNVQETSVPHSHAILSTQHPITSVPQHFHKPGLIAKVVSSTVPPPYEDITVIPVSKLNTLPHPNAALFLSNKGTGYDYYTSPTPNHGQTNIQYPDYEYQGTASDRNYISSTISPTIASKFSNQALYYKTIHK